MLSLGYRAFETGVEGVAGEEGDEGSLPLKSRMGSVLIDDSLKARYSTSWLRRSGSETLGVRARLDPIWRRYIFTQYGIRHCNVAI